MVLLAPTDTFLGALVGSGWNLIVQLSINYIQLPCCFTVFHAYYIVRTYIYMCTNVHNSTVEPVYYGHLGTSQKCPDYQGVVIVYHLGPQLGVMQVSTFSSILINRFHCIAYLQYNL